MAYAGIRRRLEAGGIVILDGATGTELQRRGARMNPTAWCAPATLEHGESLHELAGLLKAAGCDLIILEMMYHPGRARLAIAAITDLIPASGVDAAGPMHTAVELIDDALLAARRAFAGPLVAYPDSGHFEAPIWSFDAVIAPEAFGQACRRRIAGGARVLGGCCGLGVEHVRAAARGRDALAARGGDRPS